VLNGTTSQGPLVSLVAWVVPGQVNTVVVRGQCDWQIVCEASVFSTGSVDILR
jgi:hypothetical protein